MNNNFNYENFNSNEGEESNELIWTELDWKNYLDQNKRDIYKFLGHYRELKGYYSNHLD
jgi:hypothetical protein